MQVKSTDATVAEAPIDDNKCPFCGGHMANDARRICQGCGMSDRQRCTRVLYQALRPLLTDLHCLNLSADFVVRNQNYFTKVTNSVYQGVNHIDLQNIEHPDNSFDFTVCNHVLEHVQDDKLAIREMMRVTSKAAQITVPIPTRFYTTEEYGEARPTVFYHWRHYGADFPAQVKQAVPDCHVLITVVTDGPSGNYDTSYLVVKDLEFAQRAFKQLCKEKIPCIVLS